MRSRYLAIVFFILISSSASAQSLYEMAFHFGSGKKEDISSYKAFYMLNDDGTGFMRILFEGEKPEERDILDCELTQGFATDNKKNIDYSKMYYTGNNYITVVGDTTLESLPPITFWFKLTPSGDEYKPWAVMTKDENGKSLQGVIDGQIRQLEQADLTKELILTYFTKDEEIYKNLFAVNTRPLTPEQKSSRMFLLTVIDTEDEHIGQDCEMDRKKQQAYFSKIATKLDIPIIIKEVLGKELNKTNVLNKINELAPAKSDIVIFYYSGHGYSREDGRLFPYLDLRYDKDIAIRKEDELNMEEIYEMIKNKPGRLNLVISDCCNWHASASNAKSANIANTRPSSVGLSIENIKALFMNPNRTSLMITAAAKGQVSAGNALEGGIFTGQFREALQKFMGINYENITWQQITENAQTQTAFIAGQSKCANPNNPKEYNDCKQTPVFKMN